MGVSKVSTKEEFIHAVSQGLRYDERVLVESCIQGREIDVLCLGMKNRLHLCPQKLLVIIRFILIKQNIWIHKVRLQLSLQNWRKKL